MTDILLLNTPLSYEKEKHGEDYLPPLGLGYIATYLQSNRINVEIIDCLFEHLSFTDIINLIRDKNAHFVGLNMFTPNLQIVKDIIKSSPDDIVFILGAQLTKSIYSEIATWNFGNKIIVICGEGELIMPDIVLGKVKEPPILENANCKVYNVDKNSAYFPKDISNICLDRSLFKNRIIINKFGYREACMVSSRGCIYNCSFCGGAREINRDVCPRVRSYSSIINEINDILIVNPEVESIRMLDDLFLREKNSISQSISIFSSVQLRWRAMAHVLSLNKSHDLFKQLYESGCSELFIGIESGSDQMRKMINKEGTVDEIESCIYGLLDTGINVKGYFMFGLPHEKENDMYETYKFASRLANYTSKGKFRNSTFQFRPYHGTKIYTDLLKQNIHVKSFSENEELNIIDGRRQFNIDAGNFSDCSNELLNKYIINTLKLNGVKYA